MYGDAANIFLSETAAYGFMIFNGLAVVALCIYCWRRGLFAGLDHVELEALIPEDERGDLNDK